ncbi:uncharacterized protein LOC142370441 [Odontesthes bonariensis]|uniref:uncharacterized protein LOC142370441 n=1 Tax=Odontesthes bonariensis TaxID=219752 RepID=UPI003F587E53
MKGRCCRPLLLLWLTAVVGTTKGNAPKAVEEEVVLVKNLTNKLLPVIPYNDNNALVTILAIEENQITLNELDQQALASYPALVELHLDGNLVTSVPAKFFSGLQQLRVLSLARNDISSLDPEAFSGLDLLKELDLSHNELTKLPTQLITGLTNLQTLNLLENPWNCSCPLLSISGKMRPASTIGITIHLLTSCSVHTAWTHQEDTNTTRRTGWKQPGGHSSEFHITSTNTTNTTNSTNTTNTTNTTNSTNSTNTTNTTNTTKVLGLNHYVEDHIVTKSGLQHQQRYDSDHGNTWKFTACVAALALTTFMLIISAVKGPSWYKSFHNYRHRQLHQEDDQEGEDIGSTVLSETMRYLNHQTFTFEEQHTQTEDEEQEDGYFEDANIKRAGQHAGEDI